MKSMMRPLFSVAVPIIVLGSLLCAAQTAPLNQNAAQNARPTGPAQRNYGNLPMTFEANQGQTDPRVKYLAHGRGYSVFLTSGQMVLALRPSAAPSSAARNSSAPAERRKTADTVIQLNLVGANPNPPIVGENLQPGKVNYFIGKDPKKWQTNVPIYRQVRYKGVYPGIDLVYYGNQARAEHDFIIAAGADPSQIQFDVTGADRLSLASNGDLVLRKGPDEVRLQAPILYQEFHGLRAPVTGQYKVQNSTRVSFAVGQYDKTMPLVIDPVLVYGTFLGGLADDEAVGIAVDSAGSAYVAGWTQSSNFPLAGQNGQLPGGQCAFVAKVDVSGSSLVYADFIGGSSENYPTAMAMDSSNHVFITGYTYASDFPTVNPYQANSAGAPDGFVTEVSADGGSLVYSTYLGGSSNDYPYGIALDALGDIYVAGGTYSQDFPVANAFQSTVSANQNRYYGMYGFLTKFTPDGSALAYSTYYAGSANVVLSCYGQPCWPSPEGNITGVAVDGAGNAYVAGVTNTYDFPVTESAYEATNTTTGDQQVGFVGKFSSSGSLVYSTYFAAVPANYYYFLVNAIAVDSAGSAYIVGEDYTRALQLTTPNLCDPEESGCSSGYITKFDPTGSTLVYSTYLAANFDVNPQSLLVDASGDAYVASSSGGGDPSQLVNPIENYSQGPDLLIQEIDPTGSIQLFSTFLGGYGDDTPGGIALDSSGAIYVTGNTDSTDYPVTAAALQNTLGGNYDAFVSKIGTAAAPAVSISPSLIQFSIRPVGSVSQPNTSLLRNMGSAALTVSNVTTTGDFSVTNDCGSSVAAAGACTFTVTFTPTQPGPRFGSIMIEDDGAGSPHFINLVGNGATAVADLVPSSLTFPSTQINQTTSAQTVTLTNNGNATLVISQFTAPVDFPLTDNCTGSLGIGSSCSFQISFSPTAGGARNGALSIYDNAPGSPQTVTLTGSGYVTTATVAPSSLSFANQAVGSTSTPQPVVVTDTGANPVTVSSVTTSGDFAETDDCVTPPDRAASRRAVKPAAAQSNSCSIEVTFTPTAAGSRSGTLTINDNAQGNPHTVALSGTGLAGVAQLSASSLSFSALAVGTTSTAQTITVTNSGNGALTVSSVQATGDFAQTNNCTTVAASGGTCAIQVTFTPTASGTRTGTLTLTDSAANSPQLVSLTGSGLAGVANLSTSGLTFTTLAVGSTSAAQTVTITNPGNGALTFTVVQATGDFAQTNNCTTVAASGGTCAIQVTFTPAASGTRTGTLTVTDSAANSPQLVSLTGSGVDFSMPSSGGTASIKAGATATYQLSISPVGGTFSSAISLACAGLPAFSTCTLNPTSVTPGSTAASVSVSIKTTGTSARLASSTATRPVLLWLAAAPMLSLFGLCLTGTRRGRRRASLLLLLLIVLLGIILPGCGNSSTTTPPVQTGNSTPPGTYTVLVIGTSGSVQHFSSLTLTVQ